MSHQLLGIALATVSLAMFAVNIVMTRYAMARLRLDVGFLIAVIVNVLFAAVAFCAESWLRASPLVFDAQAFWLFVLSGVFTTYLGRWFFFETVARLGPARASTFQISSPMFTALVAWLFLGETLPPIVVLAMLVVVAGLYFAGQPTARSSNARSHLDGESKHASRGRLRRTARALVAGGFALGVGSAMAYAVGNVVRGAAIHRWHEPIAGALLGAIAGIILHLTFSPASRRLVAEVRTADRRGVVLYAAGGVLTISAQMLTIASMSYIPVSIAALITLCTPLIVVPVSHALFGREQPVTPRVYLGTVMALAGIAVIVLR